jgi:hypothetical protein
VIHLDCVVSPDGLRRNREHAAGLGLPWLVKQPETGRPLAIVGGGRSSETYLDEILAWPGDIMAINGAYRWLMERGRVADSICVLDPQANLAPLLECADPTTRLYVASMCDPAVFDVLKARDVVLWSAPQSMDDREPGDVPGGPSAMARAPVLALYLGYRSVTLYGADSCYFGPDSHVYGGRDADPKVIVRCDGRDWLTKYGLVSQAEYLAEMIQTLPFDIRLRGDHLASALLKTGEWL